MQGTADDCALDGWMCLQLHAALIERSPIAEPVTRTTPIGTQVLYVWGDHVLAYGTIPTQPDTFTIDAVQGGTPETLSLGSTRTVVEIMEVLSSAAQATLHKRTLASFGPPPFQIIVNTSRLRTYFPPSSSQQPIPPTASNPTPPSAGIQCTNSSAIPNLLNSTIPQAQHPEDMENYSIQDPVEDVFGQDLAMESDSDLDDTLQAAPPPGPCHQPLVIPDSGLDSRILEDCFHVMNRVV